jgi:hypothetical protein
MNPPTIENDSIIVNALLSVVITLLSIIKLIASKNGYIACP